MVAAQWVPLASTHAVPAVPLALLCCACCSDDLLEEDGSAGGGGGPHSSGHSPGMGALRATGRAQPPAQQQQQQQVRFEGVGGRSGRFVKLS